MSSLVQLLSLILGISAVAYSHSSSQFTPNGKKAGSAGSRALPFWKDHLGWYYDWSPVPRRNSPGITPVPMLWGGGGTSRTDAAHFDKFLHMPDTPKYVLGFNEPDCPGQDVSANMAVSHGVNLWNSMIVPWAKKGTLLGSPAMCHQRHETWLKDFSRKPLARSWDFTAIHIYKPDLAGVQANIDYYWNTYRKPIWVTELGCVFDDGGWRPCTDQKYINRWIYDVVDLLENNPHVAAYAYTDGGGLGNAWNPTNAAGTALSESGRTYLSAIKKYN